MYSSDYLHIHIYHDFLPLCKNCVEIIQIFSRKHPQIVDFCVFLHNNIQITMAQLSKNEAYKTLIPQIEALIGKETDFIANLANIAAAIKQTFGFFWVGFYLVKGDELVLGPFQGTVACTRIKYGRGVCGTSWKESRTIIVPDVHLFDGHIACSSLSQSEIVIPIYQGDTVIGVLDIDSDILSDFDETDGRQLEEICKLLSNRLTPE